jgi:hypothetical protein
MHRLAGIRRQAKAEGDPKKGRGEGATGPEAVGTKTGNEASGKRRIR